MHPGIGRGLFDQVWKKTLTTLTGTKSSRKPWGRHSTTTLWNPPCCPGSSSWFLRGKVGACSTPDGIHEPLSSDGHYSPKMLVMEAQRRTSWNRCDGSGRVLPSSWWPSEAEAHRFSEIWAEHRLDEDGSSQPQVLIGTLREGMIAEALQWVVVTDAEIFGRYKIQRPRRLKSAHAVATRSIMQVDFSDLEEGDLVHLSRILVASRAQTTAHASKRAGNFGGRADTWSLNMPPKAGVRPSQALCPRQ